MLVVDDGARMRPTTSEAPTGVVRASMGVQTKDPKVMVAQSLGSPSMRLQVEASIEGGVATQA